MRTLAETQERWQETLKHASSFADLQRAVKFNGPNSPCLSGCRSVCWKSFLLFQHASSSNWSQILSESRTAYSSVRDKYLRFVKHPEQLAALSFDPLADDPNSPWDVARQDELVRAEILQDVQRLPDEPFYHEARTQTMILDILFLYCKLNPSAGGYRQGMHEVLGPIVYVVYQDAIDRLAATSEGVDDQVMLTMLDASFVEHDAFALFAKVMQHAQAFYEVAEGDGASAREQNTIVGKSKHIHETLLMKTDQELAKHLTNIEVLPQIFLIRWIRLLFGREFPFEQLMVLWDTMFAFDPSLELVDLICVAMLIRIRWTLLEADYSVALQLLLKYPATQPPHGPHTFVDDAIYLRDHTNAAGGSTLIMKYTGKAPVALPLSQTSSRPSTPTFQALGALRQRTLGARSPLSSSARLLQQPGGVEALLQGAAKNMMERGEKLGINQAVRDAVGEIRRNVQGIQDSRTPRGNRDPFWDGRSTSESRSASLTLLERRNKQLATMLTQAIDSLTALAAGNLEGDKNQHLQTIEIATAKAQLVKVYLEDSSLALPEEDLPSISSLSISAVTDVSRPTVALDTTPVVLSSSAVEIVRSTLSSPASDNGTGVPANPSSADDGASSSALPPHDSDHMDTDMTGEILIPSNSIDVVGVVSETISTPTKPVPTVEPRRIERPSAPIPTRSTLAQSSFSWMLEPDTTTPATLDSTFSTPPSSTGSASGTGKRRGPGNASRERNAFLFGEVTGAGPLDGGLSTDEIFGLKPMGKGSRSGTGTPRRSGSLPRVAEDTVSG